MKLSDVHAHLSDCRICPTDLPARNALPYLAAFSVLTRIEGVPLLVYDNAGTAFAQCFPKTSMPSSATAHFGSDVAGYNSWRNLILDALLLSAGAQVDTDAWDGLRRVARICRGRAFANRLYHVSSRVPQGTPPRNLTSLIALEIDSSLTGQDSRSFRQGLGAIDALQDEALAQKIGILPPATIGKLPKLTDHLRHFPLPPALAEFWTGARSTDQNALSFVWRIARLACVFTDADNPTPATFFADGRDKHLADLDPQDFGLRRPSRGTYWTYLSRLSCRFRSLGGVGLPKGLTEVERRWSEVKSLALQHAAFSSARVRNLAAVSTPAINEELSPSELAPEWFKGKIATLSGAKRRAFLSACYLIDELRAVSVDELHLFPPEGTGVQRQRKRQQQG
ncbi:hypothetical protein [Pseudoprimorskyibacter insulae]|uniref:Uncharacterized protein n=1 Tax=Pseudoprimorskyibacter insulae TaxID=1695997 RepID=A0A2R8APZ9_9RHOB|nr:hypothetical protein [Pseudoprimorskyibacter insulae]SPF78103.1 hypothetical protein PRI8871_00694 [Pseudoprimorskyibacter insulae]